MSAQIQKKRHPAPWIALLLLAGCSTSGPQEFTDPQSAAQYCAAQGGTRKAERGPHGEIGICAFADGHQCEEWALLLGRCPRGGVAVGGYATTSERHCAIRGGSMTIPGCALSPVGFYETTVRTTRGGGERNVVLVLEAGRAAMLSTTYSGGAGRYLAPGTWRSSGNVVTVSTEHERLVFDYANDQLVPREWDRSAWGGGGPGTLVRTR
jgi:putative hemolysin